MIMADKIIRLRKMNGWSQEELAEQMNVSRQAVSKWESAQSVPDLEKLLRLSELFGVTTDYLLKDDIEEAEFTDVPDATMQTVNPDSQQTKPLRRVTLGEANEYLALRQDASKRIAIGTVLCILAPVFLFMSLAISEIILASFPGRAPSPTLGLIGMILIVAAAVALFISTGNKSAHFAFLDTEPFETEYGVSGMVKERQAQFRDRYTRFNLIGTVMCVLSPILLFMSTYSMNNAYTLIMLSLMLCMVAAAVYLFIRVGVVNASMKRLLQEGDYTPQKKQSRSPLVKAVSTAYWLTAVAVYLAWSFIGDAWDISWVVWVVAGVLYGGVIAVMRAIGMRK